MSLVMFDDNVETNPFLGQALVGWTPFGDRVRFPVTFAVDCEADRVLVLRASPIAIQQILPALPIVPGDTFAVLSGGGEALAGRPRLEGGIVLVEAEMLASLTAPVEVLHLGAVRFDEVDARHLPETILLDPVSVLRGRTRFAFSIQDGCHGLLLCQDMQVLREGLGAFLQSYQVAMLGRCAHLPRLTCDLLDPLLAPTPPDAFREVRFFPGPHYWSMRIDTTRAGSPPSVLESVQWVAEGERGRWRGGWSW